MNNTVLLVIGVVAFVVAFAATRYAKKLYKQKKGALSVEDSLDDL